MKKLNIREFEISDTGTVISMWQECGLATSWNNPRLDFERTISFQKGLFFVNEFKERLIASAMFGSDDCFTPKEFVRLTKYLYVLSIRYKNVLEHVCPSEPNEPWQQHFGSGAEVVRNRLGNMVLLARDE